jgi:quercetin dioxygenase-like cupin family protein
MHISPGELRLVRQEGLLLRYTVLGGAALVLVEVPGRGSSGTALEEPCREPHWGVVVQGEMVVERAGRTSIVPAGAGYHLPAGGPEHRFRATAGAVLLGFVPPEEQRRGTDGFDRLRPAAADDEPDGTVILPGSLRLLDARLGQVEAEMRRLDSWVFTRETFGRTSGYGSGYCDLPHWGLVVQGTLAIDWEDDVEVLTAGDLFHCPAGPPGHRLEAPDGAIVVGFTSADALLNTERTASWLQSMDGGLPAAG